MNGAHGSGPNLGHHGGAGGDNGFLQPATHELLRPRFIQVHGYKFSLLATCTVGLEIPLTLKHTTIVFSPRCQDLSGEFIESHPLTTEGGQEFR